MQAYKLGLKYLHGVCGLERDLEKAHYFLKLAANQGYWRALLSLAFMDLETNVCRAFIRFKDLADDGCINAQYMVGLMYEHGEGKGQSDKKALYYYEKAAKRGHLEAESKVEMLIIHNKEITRHHSL